jgi:hypothetical protein
LALRNDVGLLADEFGTTPGRMLGNSPQAFSHVAPIDAALNLTKPQRPAEQRSGRQYRQALLAGDGSSPGRDAAYPLRCGRRSRSPAYAGPYARQGEGILELHDMLHAVGIDDVERGPLVGGAVEVDLAWPRNGDVDALKDDGDRIAAGIVAEAEQGKPLRVDALGKAERLHLDLGVRVGELSRQAIEQLAHLGLVERLAHDGTLSVRSPVGAP